MCGRYSDGGAINAAVVLRIGLKVLCLGRFKGDPAALVVGFRKGQIAVRSGDDDGRKFVTESGLLVGGNTLPNGEANFMWQDFLTREQFATVLYRFAQKFGLN